MSAEQYRSLMGLLEIQDALLVARASATVAFAVLFGVLSLALWGALATRSVATRAATPEPA